MNKNTNIILAAQKHLSAAVLTATGSLKVLPIVSSAALNFALAIVTAIDAESRLSPSDSAKPNARGKVKK
ncbi:MAG: hypothetical protein V4650_08450 [Pseudomonadota bacterium]